LASPSFVLLAVNFNFEQVEIQESVNIKSRDQTLLNKEIISRYSPSPINCNTFANFRPSDVLQQKNINNADVCSVQAWWLDTRNQNKTKIHSLFWLYESLAQETIS
jgi:hypothetical protein